jgi:natural resistance-associated macrophage protein
LSSHSHSTSHADENLNGFDEWINVLQSLQLPFALFPLLHFTSSPGIMGRFVNPRWMNILSWLVAILVVSVNVFLIFNTFKTSLPHTVAVFLPLGIAMLGYSVFSLYLAVGPFLSFGTMNHIYGPMARKGLVGANLRSRLNQLNFQDLEGEANSDGFADDFAPLLHYEHDSDEGL